MIRPAACKSRLSVGSVAFTLVELLVSMVILLLILLVLVSITDSTRRTWSLTNSRIEVFRQAREAFDSMTRRLNQATLRTYWDYRYVNGVPTTYIRQSELRFLCGPAGTLASASASANPNGVSHAVFFQAPLGTVSDPAYTGLESLLNTCGYFIEWGSDQSSRPAFINNLSHPPPPRWRFRLMELLERSEKLTLYQFTSGFTNPLNGTTSATPNNPAYYTLPALPGMTAPTSPAPMSNTNGREWYTTPLTSASRPVRALADNVVAVILLPRLSPADEQAAIDAGRLNGPLGSNLAPRYAYDSTAVNTNAAINPKNQLPASVQVTMVAVDEASFKRVQGVSQTMPDFGLGGLFQSVGNVTDPTAAGYAADLRTLEQSLQSRRLTYRVFTTSIDLKAAKWSAEQTQN